MTNKPAVVLLFGPTAVGKTDCLTELFCDKAEIINADSMQVYRGMDIGTAKPDSRFLSRIPHHLIDIRSPNEPFNAGDFVKEAERLLPEILSRGRLPVICGGTAFYFINFLFGLPQTPPTDRKTAAEIESEVLNGGRERLFEELRLKDPVSAARIPIGDTYRLVRALEVFRTSGRPLSSYQTGQIPRSDYRFKIIELTRPRAELYERINRRVEQMFNDGLPEEWKRLCVNGCTADSPGMRAIGYAEFFRSDNPNEVKELIQKNSRRYAKRQITFFQKIPERRRFSPSEIEEMRDFIFL